jgi:phosphoribosylformylglycinamidine synthase PurS subunit
MTKKEKKAKAEKISQAVVYVSLKNGVLDPQGLTIKRALEDLGYKGIKEVRSGKFYQIKLNSQSSQNTKALVSEISNKLLANPVIETFEIKGPR